MTAPLRLVALTAGLSAPSSTRMLTDQLSRSAVAELGARGRETSVEVVELRDVAHETTDALLSGFPGEKLAAVFDAVRAADAVILATPVFNLGPSGLVKTFLDAAPRHLWEQRPVLLAATAGTPRHSLVLDYAVRPMLGYLKADLVPTAVFAASGDFGADGSAADDAAPLDARIRRAARELAVMVAAAPAADGPEPADRSPAPGDRTVGRRGDSRPTSGTERTAASGLDPEFSDFVPMDSMLGRS